MNIAIKELALATGTGAVFATVGQHDALAQRRREYRLVFVYGKTAATGLYCYRKLFQCNRWIPTCPGFRHSTGWGARGKFPATGGYAKVRIPVFLRRPEFLRPPDPLIKDDIKQMCEVFTNHYSHQLIEPVNGQ